MEQNNKMIYYFFQVSQYENNFEILRLKAILCESNWNVTINVDVKRVNVWRIKRRGSFGSLQCLLCVTTVGNTCRSLWTLVTGFIHHPPSTLSLQTFPAQTDTLPRCVYSGFSLTWKSSTSFTKLPLDSLELSTTSFITFHTSTLLTKVCIFMLTTPKHIHFKLQVKTSPSSDFFMSSLWP